MKKLVVLFVCTLLTVVNLARSADFASVTVEGGYNNSYVVNGVELAKEVPYAGVAAIKSLKYADVYVGGLLIANKDVDQSHWLIGAGKTLSVWDSKNVALRADANVLRHQTSSIGIENSTEFGVKLALQNPLITPYVRGSFNLELEQKGYFFGAERAQKLPFGFVLTPAVEWGRVTDYDTIHAKAELTRPFTFAWGAVTPFAGIGWYDNPEWNSASTTKFALRRFQSDTVYNAGLKFSF